MTRLVVSLLVSLWCAEFTTSQEFRCSEPDRVRLNDANGYFTEDRAGRVEICDCSISTLGCQWKTITVPTGSIAWGWKNALVVCREVYPEDYGVMNPILQDTLPSGVRASSLQFVLNNAIDCDGTEASIANCSTTPSFVTSHPRDAYIWCRSSPPIQGDVRLSGSSVSNSVGVVEIYEGSSVGWVTMCNGFWDLADAEVACMQLGYESGTPTSFDSTNFAGSMFGDVSRFSISCNGFETYLGSCFFTLMTACVEPSIRGGVTCSASGLPEGSVRLNPPSDVDTNFDRRAEVLYDGRWGTICDDDWDTSDGDVVCQSLGLDSASIDTTPIFSSTGVARAIWLSSLFCDGTEDDLTLCTKTYPVGYAPSCTNNDDAALECDGGGSRGLSVGAIISIVIAVVVVLVFLIPFVVMCCKMNPLEGCECPCDFDCSVPNPCSCLSRLRRRSARRPAPRPPPRPAATMNNVDLVQVTRRSDSRSSSNSAGDFAEPGHSSPPALSPDTELRRGAPPSYFDAVRLGTNVPVATLDPPQYTAPEPQGDPESSLPSYSISTSHLSHPPNTSTELTTPQTSNAEPSAPSHPQAASDAGDVHTNSEMLSTHPMPADVNIPTSTFQQALGFGVAPPPPEDYFYPD